MQNDMKAMKEKEKVDKARYDMRRSMMHEEQSKYSHLQIERFAREKEEKEKEEKAKKDKQIAHRAYMANQKKKLSQMKAQRDFDNALQKFSDDSEGEVDPMRVRGSFYEMNFEKPGPTDAGKNTPKQKNKKQGGYRLKPITTSKQYTIEASEENSPASHREYSLATGQSRRGLSQAAKSKEAKRLNVYFGHMRIVQKSIDKDLVRRKKNVYRTPRGKEVLAHRNINPDSGMRINESLRESKMRKTITDDDMVNIDIQDQKTEKTPQ